MANKNKKKHPSAKNTGSKKSAKSIESTKSTKSMNRSAVSARRKPVEFSKSDAAAATPLKMSMMEKITGIYLLLMFVFFPIYMTNKLFNIREDRKQFFVVSTFIFLFFIVASYICGIEKERWPKLFSNMSVADWSFVAFTVISFISAISSDYGDEAFTGSGGRDSGFWLLAMYFLAYLLISRYFGYGEFIFMGFAVMSSLVCIYAVLNEFEIDPFNLIHSIKPEQQKDFISTIGNINMFSGFVCVSLSVCLAMAVISDDLFSRIFYIAASSFNFMGLLCANSLGGYLGIGAVLAVLIIYAVGTPKRIFNLSLTLTCMLLSAKVLRLTAKFFDDQVKNLQDVSYYLVFNNKVYIVIFALAALTALAFINCKFTQKEHYPVYFQIAVASLIGLGVLSVIGAFIYYSFYNTEAELGKLERLLRFNDAWGTHRGYAWIRGLKLFKSSGIKTFLVGCGPDTFGQFIKSVYYDEMVRLRNKTFDSAHNEFINYLVTVGALGLISYLTLIGSVIFRCAKRCKNHPVCLVAIAAIVGYGAQSFVSLSTPIITTYMFIFIAIGEGLVRYSDAGTLPIYKPKTAVTKTESKYETPGYIRTICFCFPVVGFIAAIIYSSHEKKKMSTECALFAAIGFGFFAVIAIAIRLMMFFLVVNEIA